VALVDLDASGILMSDDNAENSIPRISRLSKATVSGDNEKEMFHGLYGDFRYRAPEVLLGKAYSKPADVWSLGVIMFYILTGQLPFTEANYG
jgi:serine/threonine protein kinase